MVKFDPLINTFTSGELSPRLIGRSDLDQYNRGARRLRNMLTLPQGGVTRRPGTWFAHEAYSNTAKSRLIPFRFSTDIAYVIEASDYVFRFYVNGGILESGGVPVVLSTPYSADQVKDLAYAQEADVLYLVHPDFQPKKLSRTSPTTFTLTNVKFSRGRAPMGPFNVDAELYISDNDPGVTYTRRLTFSKAHGLTSADINRHMLVYRYRKSSTIKYRAVVFLIKQIVNSTKIEVNYTWEYEDGDGDSIKGADSYTFALGLFSATEGCRAVTFHEGRLVYAGFKRKPDYIAFSVSDDFDNFENENIDPDLDESFNADKAIYRRTVSRDVNEIKWVTSSGQVLMVGTTGGEFIVRSNSDDVLTPTSAMVKNATARGSENGAVAVVEGDTFFVQRGGTVVRRLAYDFQVDFFKAIDITVLAEHLFQPGIKEIAYQQWPYAVIWCLRNDGQLVGITYDGEQSVVACHLHTIGGSYAEWLNAKVESIAVIPGKREDQLWMVVARTVGGSVQRTIELLSEAYEPAWDPDASREERITQLDRAMFLDSAIELDVYKDVTAASFGTPLEITTATAHGFSVGDRIRFRGFGGYTGRGKDRTAWGKAELNNKTYRVRTIVSPTKFTVETLDGVTVNGNYSSAFVNPNNTARVYKEVSSVSGAGHLENALVDVWADGAYLGKRFVSNGIVQLNDYASHIVVGYGYSSQLETMPVVGGNPRGSDQGLGRAISRVLLQLRNSAGGKIGRGPSPSQMDELIYRLGEDPLDQPAPPLTGIMQLSIPSSWERDPTILLEVDTPAPFTLLSMTIQAQSPSDA